MTLPGADRLPFAPVPVTLTGEHVLLRPLERNDFKDLIAHTFSPGLFAWYPFPYESAEELRAGLEEALTERDAGRAVPFVIVLRATGEVVGSTRTFAIDRGHRRLEIGYTWVGAPWQRSAVNTEAKLLLMAHAFETLGALRVEFKTDSLNAKSRAALAGIGATEEGLLRSHMLTRSGRVRDSVYFSVIAAEWEKVKAGLERRLRRLAPR